MKSKNIKKLVSIILISLFLLPAFSFTTMAAEEQDTPSQFDNPVDPSASSPPQGTSDVGDVQVSATHAGVCADIAEQGDDSRFPPCAESPAQCGSGDKDITPPNCLFLQEPIGGKTGYDLYRIDCEPVEQDTVCHYKLWYGEAITGEARGPIQAILSYEPGKEFQGPFGLLYSYVGLIYQFLSGIIVGFVVIMVIIGGITMTTSYGDSEKFRKGRAMITKAIIGMLLWFLASVILYTINPTFFVF